MVDGRENRAIHALKLRRDDIVRSVGIAEAAHINLLKEAMQEANKAEDLRQGLREIDAAVAILQTSLG